MSESNSSTYEYLLSHYGPLLTLKHLAEVMHTTPAGGVKKEPAYAVKLYRRAAAQGHVKANHAAQRLAGELWLKQSRPKPAPAPRVKTDKGGGLRLAEVDRAVRLMSDQEFAAKATEWIGMSVQWKGIVTEVSEPWLMRGERLQVDIDLNDTRNVKAYFYADRQDAIRFKVNGEYILRGRIENLWGAFNSATAKLRLETYRRTR